MSRAEYYREYRKRKKVEHPDSQSEFTATVLHDVVQQLQQICASMQEIVQKMQQSTSGVAQQNATSNLDGGAVTISKFSDLEIEAVNASLAVAQQSTTSVAQQLRSEKKSKRKGSFPPSFPPSHPPQTPPYSSPLLSPQPPKENHREDFEISSGEVSTVASAVASAVVSPVIEDNPNLPLVEPGKNQNRDLATWVELDQSVATIWDETRSTRLQDAFYDWIEYKQERGAKEFYTKKGMLAESRHFVKRHLEEFDVPAAVERAIASNWQGWDHDLKR
jgi:hypothetical protein